MTVVCVANSMWYVVRRKACCMVQTTGQTACGRCLEWRRRKRKRNLSCVQHRVVVPSTLQTLTTRRECSGQLCFHSRVTSPPCVVLVKIVGPCGKNSANLHTAWFLFCPTPPLEPTPSKSAYPLFIASSHRGSSTIVPRGSSPRSEVAPTWDSTAVGASFHGGSRKGVTAVSTHRSFPFTKNCRWYVPANFHVSIRTQTPASPRSSRTPPHHPYPVLSPSFSWLLGSLSCTSVPFLEM